jgi:hypothetical protein
VAQRNCNYQRQSDMLNYDPKDTNGRLVAESLILDLLEWLLIHDRSYEEVMDAWRTSCPRLPVWEDANDRGLVMKDQAPGRCIIKVTASGLALLHQRRLRKPAASRIV